MAARTSEKRPAVGGTRINGMRSRVDQSYGGSRAAAPGVRAESHAITATENRYMTGEVYIACLDMDFEWTKVQVEEIKQMWQTGVPVDYIAKTFKRDADEVALLLMDLRRKKDIQKRKGGYFGKG
jgi:hypothetical protein